MSVCGSPLFTYWLEVANNVLIFNIIANRIAAFLQPHFAFEKLVSSLYGAGGSGLDINLDEIMGKTQKKAPNRLRR